MNPKWQIPKAATETSTKIIYYYYLSYISMTTTTTNCDYGSALEKLLRSGFTLLNDINSHFCLRKCNARTYTHYTHMSSLCLTSFVPFGCDHYRW